MANCGTTKKQTYETQKITNDTRWNNSKTVMRLLLGSDLGLEPYMAAGIVGNMWGESQMNPTTYISTDNKEGQSGGLCQWHDTVNGNGRFTNLKNYAGKIGKQWQDLPTQVNFLIGELKSKRYSGVLKGLKESDNATKATIIFCEKFEVSSACYDGKTPTERIKKANEVLQRWNA